MGDDAWIELYPMGWWPRPDSNRHSGYPEADFKSAVSTIPPRGLRGVLKHDSEKVQVFSFEIMRRRESRQCLRAEDGRRPPSVLDRVAPDAFPILTGTVGDAAVLLVEFVGDLEHRQHQPAFRRPGHVP